MRESAASEDDGIRAGKTIFADIDRLRGLAAFRQIDAVGDELRAKSSHGSEGADAHPRRAIEQMPAGDRGMPFHQEFRTPVGLMREVPAGAAGETGNPIQLPDRRVRAEMKKVDILAEGEMPDARTFFHDETARQNPGKTDAAAGMDRIAELFLEK